MAGTPPRSPLAPEQFPNLPRIGGVSFSAVAAGVKYQGRTDVMLAQIAPGSSIAGVFTKSSTRAAPVLDCQAKIGGDSDAGAAVIVNSGNANAFTGKNGIEATRAVTNAVASALDLPETRVFSSSTGVIGEPLAHDRITAKIVELQATLDEDAIEAAAEAIRTTDTFAKGAGAETDVNGSKVSIAGIAKGSGMIAPNLATMLSFIFTNADINSNLLKTLLKRSVANSFNAITVDSDQSTNDMVSIFSTRTVKIGHNLSLNDKAIQKFEVALKKLCLNLAKQTVVDGEGAKKFVTINVINAKSLGSAKNIAFSIANSPLVKTAVAGEDPNWGRIIMGIGKSGEIIDPKKLKLKIGSFVVAENGKISESYDEQKLKEYMEWDSIEIEVNLKLGNDAFKCYTCDFTHDYIDINADYRN